MTGPNTFGRRLAECFVELGHQVVDESNNADISLVFIEPTGKKLARKVVQRLDGIWFSPEQFHTHNTKIKSLYASADAVVWQSIFDKNMTTKWWKQPKNGIVISNGVNPKFANDANLARNLNILKQKYEKLFVCAANWHGQKRLLDNIKLFNHLKQFYKSACLLVLGGNARVQPTEDIFIVGSLPQEHCMQIYKSCDWMIHLAWLDHCPNTVVEALACGTPVICTEDGGTKEIVGSYGIVLQEKTPYDYDLVDYDNPPSLDFSQIMKSLPKKESLGAQPFLKIEDTAKSYLDFFQSI